MSEFYLPYQFIPVTGKVNGHEKKTHYDDIKKGALDPPARHDLWLPNTHSGRIICKLLLETPTFVGAQRNKRDGEATLVYHYKRNGKLAIPGNSLRGMIGYVMETLSQSALRVLENRRYSVRKRAEKALTAVGRLRKTGTDFDLIPMMLPKISSENKPELARRALSVPNEVIHTFKELVRERWIDSKNKYPIFPEGYKPPDENGDWEPLDGMLVFFGIEAREDGEIRVSEISFSAIWREAIDKSTWDLFSALGEDNRAGRDLLPWNSTQDYKRENLTPAERLLGVVEEGKGPRDDARWLASRVRFSDALPTPGNQVEHEGADTLKILSSPKPPSPAMYLHKSSDAPDQRSYIPKWHLNRSDIRDTLRPNGRKVYLHHPHENGKLELSYETKVTSADSNLDQKVRCCPRSANQSFWFHVDFDNLNDAELNLLVKALRPSPDFRHRLGLGKPLGLGSVEVSIEGVFFINRAERYGAGAFDEPRYHEVWSERPSNQPIDWGCLYAEEAQALAPGATPAADTGWRYNFALIDKDTLLKLLTVGCPRRTNLAVHYPLRENQLDPADLTKREQDTYQWFVDNDIDTNAELSDHHQALPPIKAEAYLPRLKTYTVLRVKNLPRGNNQSLQEKIRHKFEGFSVLRVRIVRQCAEVVIPSAWAVTARRELDNTKLDGKILRVTLL